MSQNRHHNEAPLSTNHTSQQQSTVRQTGTFRNVQHHSPTAIHHSLVAPRHSQELCGCCFSAQSIKYSLKLLHHPIHLTVTATQRASEQIGWNITLPKAASSNIWEKKKKNANMSLVLDKEEGRGMCDFYDVISNYVFL